MKTLVSLPEAKGMQVYRRMLIMLPTSQKSVVPPFARVSTTPSMVYSPSHAAAKVLGRLFAQLVGVPAGLRLHAVVVSERQQAEALVQCILPDVAVIVLQDRHHHVDGWWRSTPAWC